MGREEERERFIVWWEATGGGNTSLHAVAEQAWMCGTRMERKACISIFRDVAERYPADIFPEQGQSLDCKSARMARLTAAKTAPTAGALPRDEVHLGNQPHMIAHQADGALGRT